ncbi:NAD(P)/FAD-dependent oxidoreductase [Salinisphaera sp.]|uniref:NAD(P)/FAD-dependent oxidoreductase n=1 Tax=Salinisphaera sp. TaxID=1914330 RepID=UPI002D787EDD|nr:NAD(P)/FAD-dependent oxidoreductase [Salinisphaera sp.]HET7313276.1 NAD(P)/FAD-dependent oxidoreductase [Salinisphaera sp.]
MNEQHTDIAVIGAGPAGATVAALLADRGWRVRVLERSHFPRFAVGESLLPRCMDALAAAGMLHAVENAGYQIKRGVTFTEAGREASFSFDEQFTPGWASTWQVLRADFDHRLAQEAERRGASLYFGQTVDSVDFSEPGAPRLSISGDDGTTTDLSARFVCDASGFARVLPRLLDLDRPGNAPARAALFTHVTDRIDDPDYRRDRLVIGIHPEQPTVWYWLIGLAGGRASVGVIGPPEWIHAPGGEPADRLQRFLREEPHLARLLANANFDSRVNQTENYGYDITALHGRDYALLGNAAGFVDPIFSSGVTVALESALHAVAPIDAQLRGGTPDWAREFEAPIRAGQRVFTAFIAAWYGGALKHVFFDPAPDPAIRTMIASILAGYVWDTNNPYAAQPERRLDTLCRLCAP